MSTMLGVRFRWKTFFLAWAFVYLFFVLLNWIPPWFARNTKKGQIRSRFHKDLIIKPQKESTFTYTLKYKGQLVVIDDVLRANNTPSLQERVTAPSKNSSIKKIYSNSAFGKENLNGCPDFRCEITEDPHAAEALINFQTGKRDPNKYYIFANQESPAHAGNDVPYNFTLNFRQDSPSASPYGYTVHLSEKKSLENEVNSTLIEGKTKGAAWWVSHCSTNSGRENYVKQLQNFTEVDIYGSCGTMRCEKGSRCEDRLDTDYHFYMALENSLCRDYITEKLWGNSFRYTVVPIVLKREIVEPYAPPNSFIAFDDFKSVREMGEYLNMLMKNKSEYMKYFAWKKEYKVIYLDGVAHDDAERLWGLCQVCRLLHLDPRPHYPSPDIHKHWTQSCEYGPLYSNRSPSQGKL